MVTISLSWQPVFAWETCLLDIDPTGLLKKRGANPFRMTPGNSLGCPASPTQDVEKNAGFTKGGWARSRTRATGPLPGCAIVRLSQQLKEAVHIYCQQKLGQMSLGYHLLPGAPLGGANHRGWEDTHTLAGAPALPLRCISLATSPGVWPPLLSFPLPTVLPIPFLSHLSLSSLELCAGIT